MHVNRRPAKSSRLLSAARATRCASHPVMTGVCYAGLTAVTECAYSESIAVQWLFHREKSTLDNSKTARKSLELLVTDLGCRMRPRTFVIITLLAACGLDAWAQGLSSGLPPASPAAEASQAQPQLPDDPGQEAVPVAQPEPTPSTGTPIEWQAQHQDRTGDVWTLSGNVVVHYRDYILR